ncbi:MAG TPA: ATPase, T2SS/T4P/T4SS family, partial [Acidimicrobiales bacterium]|nr:ATPase, T2SS/T4P/T4SS family [Acidimicrobiales bacterium]
MTRTKTGRGARQAAERDERTPLRRVRLGDWLLARGLLSEADVASALSEQRRTGDPLGQLLVARGLIDEEELYRALAGIFELPFRDLIQAPPTPSAAARLPESFCRRRGVLPVGFDGSRLTVAVTDPADVLTLDDAQVVAGAPVDAVIVTPSALRLTLDRAFTPGAARRADVEGGPAGPQSEEAQADARVAGFVEHLLERAVAKRASDVHLEPSGTRMRVRIRVDGVLHDAVDLVPAVPAGTVNRLKILAGLDIAEHRRPQDGRMTFSARGRTVDARVATLPTVHGEALTLRILDRDQGLLDIGKLGFDPEALERLRSSYTLPWGLILAVGPTGCGKSTTIYSILSEINEPSRNVITVEDPVEYDIAGIKQTQVHERIGYTFAAGLRSILRSDPDVIVIGEIRDTVTAKTAAEAALTGHLVLSTLHANDAATATARLLEMDLEPYLVASALSCVVAQRLVRRLCQHCRVPYEPTEDERLALDAMAAVASAHHAGAGEDGAPTTDTPSTGAPTTGAPTAEDAATAGGGPVDGPDAARAPL